MNYDLIGDIHGHSEPLVELLDKLSYSNSYGIFRHPDRKAIFLGDFIDRGPDQRGVLEIVRPMIDEGASDYGEIIEWFRTLPLWLEVDGIRVVHACWNNEYMQFLPGSLSRSGTSAQPYSRGPDRRRSHHPVLP